MPAADNYVIRAADVRLQGFTVAELKTILRAIRDVEQHRPTKLIFIHLDTPDLSIEVCKALIKEIWPQ